MNVKLTIVLLLLVFSAGFRPVSADMQTFVRQSSPYSTGLIIPLYSPPGPYWQELINQSIQYPTVRMIAVVNIHYGPGWPIDQSYIQPIRDLQAAGITVIGYVWTGYGSEGLSDWIYILISEWVQWYGLTGVYLDGMSNTPGEESYYSSITNYAHSVGANLVIGNPGTSISPSYLGTVDGLITYEGPTMPSVSNLNQYPYQPKTTFGYIAYSSSFNATQILQTTQYVGLLYVSDTGLSNPANPYTQLPSYFPQLLKVLANSLTIVAMSQSTGEIWGMYIGMVQNNTWESCFSPCSFSLDYNGQHTIYPENYGQWTFESWQESQDPQTMIAVYS